MERSSFIIIVFFKFNLFFALQYNQPICLRLMQHSLFFEQTWMSLVFFCLSDPRLEGRGYSDLTLSVFSPEIRQFFQNQHRPLGW